MSIEQTGVVDAIGFDKRTGEVVLAAFDHLDWNDESRHLALLEDKLATYLEFC